MTVLDLLEQPYNKSDNVAALHLMYLKDDVISQEGGNISII